jgi:hypothetical protein
LADGSIFWRDGQAMNVLLPFPQNHILPQTAVSGDVFDSWTCCLGAGDTSCRLRSAVEGIVSLRRRSQNAQGNLSHRQKRRFLITEKGSPVTLNASLERFQNFRAPRTSVKGDVFLRKTPLGIQALGYCNSETAVAGMVFDPVPDRRIHCVPLNL